MGVCPVQEVVPFFERLGFKVPERKAVADFLQVRCVMDLIVIQDLSVKVDLIGNIGKCVLACSGSLPAGALCFIVFWHGFHSPS